MCNQWQAIRSGREVIIRGQIDASLDAKGSFEPVATLKMYGVWIVSFRLEGRASSSTGKRWFVHCLPNVPLTVSTIALCLNGNRAEFLPISAVGDDGRSELANRDDVVAARERLMPALGGQAA